MTAVGDIWLVTVQSTLFGQRIMNTFHYRISAQTSAFAEPDAAAGLLAELEEANQLRDELLAAMPPQVNMDYLTAQKIAPTRYRTVKNLQNEAGTFAADATTPNSSAAITRHDAFGTRRSSGRIEVPISTDGAAVGNGLIGAGLLDALENVADQIPLVRVSNSGAITWTPVLYHRDLPPGQEYTVITGANPETTVRVLTRRTVGRGI